MTLYRARRPARIGTALVVAAVAVGSFAGYSMAKGNLQPLPSAASAGKPVARPAAFEPQGAGAKTASGKGGSPISIEIAKASTRAISDRMSTIGYRTRCRALEGSTANSWSHQPHRLCGGAACAQRHRATATIVGALPLVFAEGAGAEARHQIGLVIAGGMSLGTLLTLYVIPAAYTSARRSRELGGVEASGSMVASGAKGD